MKVLQFASRDVSLDDVLDRAVDGAIEVLREGKVKAVVLDPEVFKAMSEKLKGVTVVARLTVPVTALSEGTISRIMAAVPDGEDYSLDDIPDVDPARAPGL